MAAPTTLTISYSTASTATLSIPTGGGAALGDYSAAVAQIVRGGGFWFTDSSGNLTFIPIGQITKIVAS